VRGVHGACEWRGGNLGAANVRLTPDDVRAIDAASQIDAQGARHPEHIEKRKGR
jgi:hypothetical protein